MEKKPISDDTVVFSQIHCCFDKKLQSLIKEENQEDNENCFFKRLN
jgi:hypothetical protein